MYALVWLVLLAFSNLVSTEDVSGKNALLPKSIFLLAGQSNMAGRGGIVDGKWNGVVPPDCAPNPRILRLNAAGGWEEAHEPLHIDIDVNKTCGIGPGMPFANFVLKSEKKKLDVIGLVPCAVGGTNIRQWGRGTELYNNLVRRAHEAVQKGGGKIEAMIWYQGEADTDKQEHAEMHEQRFERFVADLRSDLKFRNLPIIQVAVLSGLNLTNVQILRSAQLRATVPNVTTVYVVGLKFSDGIHLDGPSQVKLGRRLGETFANNIGQGVLIIHHPEYLHPTVFILPSNPFMPEKISSVEIAPPPNMVAPAAPPMPPAKSHATKSFQICFLDFLLGWILFRYVLCVGY